MNAARLVEVIGRLRCGRPIRGLYGAETVCARPVGHLDPHQPGDGIHRADEWSAFLSDLAGGREVAKPQEADPG